MTTTILPTTNQTWGFWESMGYTTADQSQAWALATTAITKATGGTPEAVRHATTASPMLSLPPALVRGGRRRPASFLTAAHSQRRSTPQYARDGGFLGG